jgi:hypothetical protein
MDKDEETALKAACIQAAAILIADQLAQFARRDTKPAPDTGTCARFAHDLFGKLTGESWD